MSCKYSWTDEVLEHLRDESGRSTPSLRDADAVANLHTLGDFEGTTEPQYSFRHVMRILTCSRYTSEV
jgi:hypothetical protein